MRVSSARRRRVYLAACLLAPAFPLTSLATLDNWTNTAGGTFNVGSNWSSNPTVPGSADVVHFDINATYNVTFSNSPTNTAFLVLQGSTTWSAATVPETYTLTNSSVVTGGTLALSGTPAFTVSVGGNLNVDANGTLVATGNSTLVAHNITLGTATAAGASGTMLVFSNVTQLGASTLSVGSTSAGNGTLQLLAGVYNTGTGLTTVNAKGQILTLGGTFNLNSDLTVTGGAFTQNLGNFTWAANHTMTVQSGGSVSLVNNFTAPTNAVINLSGAGSKLVDNTLFNVIKFNNNASVAVTSGASVQSLGSFEIGRGSNGSLTVDGANSSLTGNTGTVTFLGGNGGTGTLTLSNGSTASIDGVILCAGTGQGTLNIFSNATCTASGDFSLAPLAAASSNASINITGGTLTMTSSAALSLGTSSLSNASITIGANGTLSTSNGTTTVNPTGTIHLTGGTFNQNANITFTGGALTQTGGTFNFAANHTLLIQSGGNVSLLGAYATPTNANITVTGAGSALNDTGASATFEVNNNANFTASAGALVHTDLYFNVGGLPGTGTATFTGANTTLDEPSGTTSLGDLGNGTLTFSSGAIGNLSGLFIGGANGSHGILNVNSNATVNVGNIFIGTQVNSSTGTINVNGGTVTVGAQFNIGTISNSTGSGIVNINASGILNTNYAATILATGQLNTSSNGTINLNGNLTVTGGLVNMVAGSTGSFFWNGANTTIAIQSGGHVNVTSDIESAANGTITLSGAGSQLNLALGHSLTLDNGATLSATAGSAISTSTFTLALNGNGSATFDGANTTLTTSVLGVGVNGTGSLTLSNNTAVNSTSTTYVGVSNGSIGTLNVLSNATLTTGDLYIAQGSPLATGAVNINGGTVIMTPGSAIYVGALSIKNGGTLSIGANGTLSTSTALTTVNLTGHINLTGGTFNLNGNITLTGGAFTQTGGAFNWAANQTMLIQSGGNVSIPSTFTTPANATITVTGANSIFNSTAGAFPLFDVSNGANLTVSNGATVNCNVFFAVAYGGGNGTATFDGANTSLYAPSSGGYVARQGVGILTFSNNSLGTVSGLTLGQSVGAFGTLNVLSNATLTLSSYLTVSNTANNSVCNVNLTGGTINLTGNATLTLGATAFSSAIVTINANSTLTTGTGLTSVLATGHINLNGGTFQQNADMTFTGGTLTQTGGTFTGNGNLTLTGGTVTQNAGNFTQNGNITLTGGAFTQTGGTFTWAANHTMLIQSAGNFTLAGPFTFPANDTVTITGAGSQLNDTGSSSGSLINGNGSISVLAGGSLHADQFLSNPSGTITVDGANSSLSAAANSALGGNLLGFAATATTTFSNGSLGNVTSGFVLGHASGHGILNVQSNATLTAGALFLADDGSNGTALIAITGGTLTQNALATLTLGGASGTGTANISLSSNSTLTTGGITTINPTGNLHNAGTLTLGGVVHNFGTLFSSGTTTINANITNAGAFTLSGPQIWKPGAGFSNTAGHAIFLSNAILTDISITGGTVDTTAAKLVLEPVSKSATLSNLQTALANGELSSSALPANDGLAVFDNAAIANAFSVFGGDPADSNSILVGPELLGDANIDGHVDLNDLNTVLNHLGTSTRNWTDGNFDHAATIDLNDLNAVLNHLGTSNLPPNIATAESLLATQNVPEPASLALLLTALPLVAAKRRRRNGLC